MQKERYSEKEWEQIRYLQDVFCIECALRGLDSDKIDEMIYKVESLRRKVIK